MVIMMMLIVVGVVWAPVGGGGRGPLLAAPQGEVRVRLQPGDLSRHLHGDGLLRVQLLCSPLLQQPRPHHQDKPRLLRFLEHRHVVPSALALLHERRQGAVTMPTSSRNNNLMLTQHE